MSLSNVVFAIALTAAVLSLLDWLLSKRAKARISDAAIHIWGWLTEQRTLPYVAKLRTRPALIVLLIVGCIPIGWYIWGLGFETGGGPTPAQDLRLPVVGGIFGVVLVVYLLLFRWIAKLYGWILKGETPWRWLIKAAALLVADVAALVGFLAVESPITAQLTAHPDVTGSFPIDITILVGMLAISGLIFSLGFGLFLIVVVVLGSVLGVFAMIGLFKTAELLVARIVEYDKGPMTAAVVALTALGTILKSIGS